LKLAFVSTLGFPWGGCEVLWVATARKALLQGHEVLVSVFDWPTQHPKIVELKTLGAVVHYRRRFYPALSQRMLKKAVNAFFPDSRQRTYHDYLLDFKADRIFFNLAGGNEVAGDETDLMVFVRQLKIPFFLAYHSLSDRPLFSFNTIQNHLFASGKASFNFFTSQFQLELLQHQVAAEIPHSMIINHPLNIPAGEIPPYPETAAAQFAVVGSLVCQWKGQDMLLKIMSKEHWLDRSWQLNIYGEGDDLGYLSRLVAFYGIAERVVFHGYKTDLNEIWRYNHILLAPSRQDSGPIVFFESMYFARPAVGSYMGAMPQYIEDGKTGVLAAGTSEADYEMALEKAWVNRHQWRGWGERAKLNLEKAYDFTPEDTLLKLLTR
jgi:glycosyltransferase involved in cell wall biosynthesis